MPYIGVEAPQSSVAAGGVLAGSYPSPAFSVALATATQVASKATYRHLHDGAAIIGGGVAIDRIPTSTIESVSAVPKANDPRLNSSASRDWDQYGVGTSAAKLDVPTWNGSVYIPRQPPPPGSVLDAAPSRKGGIVLKGDLGGTADSPRVARRRPLGDVFNYAIPTAGGYAGMMYVDPTVALRYRADVTFDMRGDISAIVSLPYPPFTGTGGEILTVELYAIVASRLVGVVGGGAFNTSQGNNSGYPKLAIPVNKVGVFQFVFSTPASRWILLSQYAEE